MTDPKVPKVRVRQDLAATGRTRSDVPNPSANAGPEERAARAVAYGTLVRELVQEAETRGLASSDLDSFVHDAKGDEAAAVNNGGLPEQIAFLLEGSPASLVRVLLESAAHSKRKDTPHDDALPEEEVPAPSTRRFM